MRLKPVAIGLWIAVFVLAGVYVADRMVAPPASAPAVAAAGSGAADGNGQNSGQNSGHSSGQTPGPTPDGAPVAQLQRFTLADLAGTRRSSDEWSGQTVLYNFWATWCAPCRREMPLLEQLYQSVAGPPGARVADPALAVVGIAIDRLEPVQRFAGETGVSYPILVGEMDATQVGESFGVELLGLPYSAVVGPDGAVLAVLLGELKDTDLALIADVADKIRTNSLTTEAARKRLASLPKARIPG
jgi:thiol-disulfide isomerase/thioredoxin